MVSAAEDDLIRNDPIEVVGMVNVRIQIAKAFAPALYDQAAKDPNLVPRLALSKEDSDQVKKTSGCVVYDDAVTVVVRVREATAEALEARGPIKRWASDSFP